MNSYIYAITKPWHQKVFDEIIIKYPGHWYTDILKLHEIKPRYIFFPHWSTKLSPLITEEYECVCFHETDLPDGRGGSPIQNLIHRGDGITKITALRMNETLDAGDVYCKESLLLHGTCEEIFIRASYIIARMIKKIIETEPRPEKQFGEITEFKRRTPQQSEMHHMVLEEVYDHIRMLDGYSYPPAYIEKNGLRYEFTRASMKTNGIIADVRITEL